MKTNRVNKENIFKILFIKSELQKGKTFKEIKQKYKTELEKIKKFSKEDIKKEINIFYKFYWRYFINCNTSDSLENLNQYEQEERLF